ncbi:MAG: DUF58 domain-containing protein [Flavobacteriales bacterium]|nr:DUF58 domain-containing protein [Flavobacteriales bacterium]
MTNAFKSIYLNNRFTISGAVVAVIFMASFPFPFLFPVGQVGLILLLAFSISDITMLFNPGMQIAGERVCPRILSLSDENEIEVYLQNLSPYGLDIEVIDELPEQFQKRDLTLSDAFKSEEVRGFKYYVRPTKRGEYQWGKIQVFCSNGIGLFKRRISLDKEQMVPVYPSIIQMKNFELMAFSKTSHFTGVKKMRRIGMSYEFEQIKQYVVGDDYRHINWKATGRRNELMVNQFQTERSQNVYSVICNSREMRMPFDELTLLDYAINASLVISNIALLKYDKAGLFTFSDDVGSIVKAERGKFQLNKIFEVLYNEKDHEKESNYELLFRGIKSIVKHRSLLFLYINFESMNALERALPALKRLSRLHLLVVMFFKNTEIIEYSEQPANDVRSVFNKTIAKRMISEKHNMLLTLKQYGIQAMLCEPNDLSLNTVNKYLELKSKGLI